MDISIFGTNGMISKYLAEYFFKSHKENVINLYGPETPVIDKYSNFMNIDLLKDDIDYTNLIRSDLIIYAAGAGVQAALKTDAKSIYELNVNVPINICNSLRINKYTGIFLSFGSYMEIGLNENRELFFSEREIELSTLPVTGDYSLSKRLFTRFISGFQAGFRFWHFILPNIFVKNETGSRLIPYVISYLTKVRRGESCERPVFSSGSQVRQYINFEDVCFCIARSIEIGIPSGIYNIGGGEVLSVRQLIIRLFNYYNVQVSEDMFGKEIRHDINIKSLKLDGGKLKDKIGYLPHQLIESIL